MKKFSSITRASSRRSWLSKRQRLVLWLVFGALALGWLVPTIVMTVAAIVLQPFLMLGNWVQTSESAIPTYLRDRAVLERQITDLEAELALNQALVTERDVLRAENDILRQARSASSSEPAGIIANVIARPPALVHDRLVLNRGSRHGVQLDAHVFAGAYIAIGTVVSVGPWQSVVELVSSPGLESTVYVFGPDIYTTAIGKGGGVLQIGVPQGVPIAVGNPVTLPAGSQAVLGAITRVETVPTRPEQFAFVTLPVPLQSLQTVRVSPFPAVPYEFAAARERIEATRSSLFSVPVPEGVLVDIPTQATSTASSTVATTTDSI